MAMPKIWTETVGERLAPWALRGLARMLARLRALMRWLRWVAGHARGAWQAHALDEDDDDVTAVDPAPAWRTRVDASANPAATGWPAARTSRVSSQELFERIMREIASSSARHDDRTRRLRASLNVAAAREDAGAADRDRRP